MASLELIYKYSIGNPLLQQRFKASRIQAAWDILGESAPSTARVAWRTKILTNPDADMTREYVWALSHALIQTTGENITDANLNIATKSFVDAWAAL